MTPSKELDALVAERIMNWKVNPNSAVTPNGIRTFFKSEHQSFMPSSDIAAAFEVIDEVNKRLVSFRTRFTKDLQLVISERMNIKRGTVLHAAEIILKVQPVDICLAALRALEP